ncbi:methyltransferase (TIGR00027 family) [Clostridium saccharoperbutylacetonicum]|uniref:S-adenosyl-L-methionine-dependent methyltransferase n=1 Tax=Clostridium saccharoperbutylacetonicum N1-4(HMT) TaxID=931276 RepID=M1MZW1_9CLOT|nr:class I SAM-dependent methyltransferase [Clostridium saccharoperbutylacetonicum]AGF56892.1 methyltransferase [Clostridium saccharoperbutylacetonicum N1-4(HMT)]NRT62349.1 methyltransferase (TIGR00027 family) [Clostridium saccharoperbutylacetonicum]NSB25686.1 methyltransferase (TIGR00027 family) [Clostridium saccharoperbutylacetonicum]NSB45052.1 methyltransferase (TIGR00027 family) [Clostridium saccharoperbutylacetonicum]
MNEKSSMTALACAFVRAYHAKNSKVKIFDDYVAEKLLTKDEYQEMSFRMAQSIKYFNPTFSGSDKEALEWIVDTQFSSVLSRAVYTEKMLENAIKHGAKQYLIFGAGFDTFAYRQSDYAHKLQIFEIDHPLTSLDKQERVKPIIKNKITNLNYISADLAKEEWQNILLSCPMFDNSKVSFCSLLGISYYLTKSDFKKLVSTISQLIPNGSSIVFDYPTQETHTTSEKNVEKIKDIVNSVGETMLAEYCYTEIKEILSNNGILVYEHLEPEQITEQYFKEYNLANSKQLITASYNVNYCLGIKNNSKTLL